MDKKKLIYLAPEFEFVRLEEEDTMDKKKPRLHKKYSFYEMWTVYNDILYIIGCAALTFLIIVLFVGACAYFNVSFTDSGMVRNFLSGGV